MSVLVEILIHGGALAVFFGLEGVFPYFPGRTGRLRHAFPNLSLAVLAAAASGLVALLLAFRPAAGAVGYGLLPRLGLAPWLALPAAVLIFDFWMYLWHRLNHRFPPLWRLHRVHHIDPEMDATTAVRFHPLEVALGALARAGVFVLVGIGGVQGLAYALVFHPVIIFHHSNIALPEKWDRLLRVLIVTPNMHRVHHSVERAETDSNYGSVFSFWDRLVRTFRKRRDTRTITFGIPDFRGRRWNRLGGMLINPFQGSSR
jgi:sterol desaturase/sphingolipid hydroxylase (fatty acid hydroxylase superfamily)